MSKKNRFIGAESAKIFEGFDLVRLLTDIEVCDNAEEVGDNVAYDHCGKFNGTIPEGKVVSLNIPPDTNIDADYINQQCEDQFLVYSEEHNAVFELPYPGLVEPVIYKPEKIMAETEKVDALKI